jgi:hypothetical protein
LLICSQKNPITALPLPELTSTPSHLQPQQRYMAGPSLLLTNAIVLSSPSQVVFTEAILTIFIISPPFILIIIAVQLDNHILERNDTRLTRFERRHNAFHRQRFQHFWRT